MQRRSNPPFAKSATTALRADSLVLLRRSRVRFRRSLFLVSDLRTKGCPICSRGRNRQTIPAVLGQWIRTCAPRWKRLLVVLYKLKPEVTPARVEAMMMNARMQLLKIPEVLSIKCGKRIDPELPWPFFIAIDFESMDKYAIFREDPIFVKFMEEVIKPNIEDSLDLDFEMDPGKDVRFS
ncbi:MAG: hypothetical protein DMF31_13130 [Verrucomicrobia bacterium]|nr:MAG: hypothetical protein DMF31_13130 [Verrucomicrobiota bacterium]